MHSIVGYWYLGDVPVAKSVEPALYTVYIICGDLPLLEVLYCSLPCRERFGLAGARPSVYLPPTFQLADVPLPPFSPYIESVSTL